MSNFIIQSNNLQKKYGKTLALESLNINVKEGIVYGLLGKNGAGKTTILRIIMSLLKPTGGEINVLGYNPWKMPETVRQKIGYSSDSMQLIPWLKVGELLNYNGSFYENWDSNYVLQWVKRLNLPINKRVFTLSRGNRQKLALLMAIGHRPKLLILDEPAGGLDPIARKEFLESMIELIHESGTTIVISSHLLSDLERISDCIGIIDSGKMKVETDLENLKGSTKHIRLISNQNLNNINIDGLINFEKRNNVMTGILTNWNEQKYTKLIQEYPNLNIEISSLNLEEIFIAYTN